LPNREPSHEWPGYFQMIAPPIHFSCQSASPELAMAAISRWIYSCLMKTTINSIIGFAVALLAPQIVQAQGMVYVSSLSQTPTSSYSVGNDSWLATFFRTGSDTNRYKLDSIALGMTNATGNPSGFTVMIYSAVIGVGVNPGSSLGTLDGSLNPVIGGIFTYTPTNNLTLFPNTDYYIVLTAGTTVANAAYNWNVSSTFSPSVTGGWGGDNHFAKSNNGSSWSFISGNYPQFAITAEPIPEPTILGLFGLGGLVVLWHRRKTKAVK
jgi:hypothetical protein